MVFLLAYWAFVLFALASSWRVGDHEVRRFVVLIGTATVGTFFIGLKYGHSIPLHPSTLADALLFIASVFIAVRSDKYWPIWFAAFQAAALLTLVSGLLFSDDNSWVFRTLSGFWAIPALLALTIGTHLDAQASRRAPV